MVAKFCKFFPIAVLLIGVPQAAWAENLSAIGLLQQAQAVSGGALWDQVAEITMAGTMSAEGVVGPCHSVTDLRTGRSKSVFENAYEGAQSGFDGRQAWIADVSGQVLITDSPDAKATARSEAYIARNGYFHPLRDPARLDEPVFTDVQGHRMAMIGIMPQGGIPLKIWIDLQTGLIDHVLEETPAQSQTTFYGDYRVVNGLKLPFHVVTKADEEVLDTAVSAYTLLPQAADADFALPVDGPSDAHIEGGGSAAIPFQTAQGLIQVNLMINGQGPFAFAFDSGATTLISPALAAQLGIKPVGAGHGMGAGNEAVGLSFANVDSLQLGPVTLSNQNVAVLDLPPALAAHGMNGQTLVGLIGYEFLKRFAVRLDYAAQTLTFTPFERFHYAGHGASVPLMFTEKTPEVQADIDGYVGRFMVDTGNDGLLFLLGSFVERNKLGAHFTDQVKAVHSGVGGQIEAVQSQGKAFRIAGMTVPNVALSMVDQQHGALSSSTMAGNIGYAILSNFAITFDYAHHLSWWEMRGL